MKKILFKPVSVLASVSSGMVAGVIFKQAWKLAAREEDAPRPTDAERGWREILAAAALQGAIFGVVRAAVDRGTAQSASRLTGTWPGAEVK
jgi:Protein of unknown function (DUF4235)